MESNELIEEEDITAICVSSGFADNTQQPFVQLLIPKADWMTQMLPEDARDLAHNLLEAADAAESDGFLVGFLRKIIGTDDERAIATLLVQFREYREARRTVR